jgi:oxygen-independent coproporphyrinogen-3 oxidase
MSQNLRTNKLPNPFEPPNRGLSLYIHIPFCERKCNYCAFDSAVPSDGDCDRYLELLDKEFAWWTRRIGNPLICTCYIGGGTPTVLGHSQWERLIKSIDSHFHFTDDAEVTVEANPNSLTASYLQLWRDWRINRVSIGVQSFDDDELRMLGRLHNSMQAREAISCALASGFSVSADFMFGLPGQTFLKWGRTLREAAHSGLHHVSLYQLSVEEGTPFAAANLRLPEGYESYRWAQWYLPKKNYIQYEISNFALPGHESRHNLNYWHEGEYLGMGPSAAGYIAGWRYKNASGLKNYAERLGSGKGAILSGERLNVEQRSREAAVLALRTSAGIDREKYKAAFGKYAELSILNALSKFSEELVSVTDENIVLTKKGMRIANRIWSEII